MNALKAAGLLLAAICLPSESVTLTLRAPCTTWLFVSTNPSGVNTNPDPLPLRPRCASIRTTAGDNRLATSTTTRE